MTTTTPSEHSTSQKVLLLGIVAYAVVWMGLLLFAYRVFGAGGATGLSLILVFPLVVAVPMRHRRAAVRGREFAFLFVLLVIVLAGSAFMVHGWYDAGMDRQHSDDLRFSELSHVAHSEAAFRNIEFSITHYKGRYVIRGMVASRPRTLSSNIGSVRFSVSLHEGSCRNEWRQTKTRIAW
jgi:hypothetical protein